jgi:hypothetical protein
MAALQWLLTPKGAAYWIIVLVVGVATAGIFFKNEQNRRAIDQALQGAAGREKVPLDARSLCDGNVERALRERVPIVPERLWCYDQVYLAAFARIASGHQTSFGDTILARYTRPTLIWNDILFAAGLAAFTALMALGLAPHMPWLWSSCLLGVFACMGIAYGIADVLEDGMLAKILGDPAHIDQSDATIANSLTRIKIVTLILSVIGAIAFKLMNVVADFTK